MFIAMNRFKVVKGREGEFASVWSSRKTRLSELPGYISFHLLKGPERHDHVLYCSHTEWESRTHFDAWTRSEQFRDSHRNAGQSRSEGLYLGAPEFEGFDAILSETNASPAAR